MKSDMITAGRISDMLNERVRDVAAMLVPGGKEDGGKWVFGNSGGAAGGSTMLNLQGQFIGKWRDWASDSDRGDLLDLWSAIRGIPLAQAIKEAKAYLGVTEPEPMKRKVYAAPPVKVMTPLSPQGRALQWFAARKITAETVELFRVEGGKDKEGRNCIVFPSYSMEGVLINRSYRPLETKDFQQEKGCAPALFGWQAITQETKRKVIICEGQVDAMTWAQWGFDCLSVPNGAKNFNWIEYEWENLEIYDAIYLSMDMDEQGREASEKLIDRLGIERCLEVTLPYKDANDCLMSGCTAEDATKWIAGAKPKKMEDLVSAGELAAQLASVFYPTTEAQRLVFAPPLMVGRGGRFSFRPGEVSAWTGYASHGKTTLLTFLANMDIEVRGSVYFFASMEMLPKKILYKMATASIGVQPSLDEINTFAERLGTKLLFANVLGYINEDKLFTMMLYCVRRYGMTSCVIDSFMAVSDLEEDFPRQGNFLARCNAFAKEYNVHIHIVCHPRKGDETIPPNMMDVKGGSLIINRADWIIVVHRNMEKAKMMEDGTSPEQLTSMTDAAVYCRKDREDGWRGRVELYFDRVTNSFSRMPFDARRPVRQPAPPPQPDLIAPTDVTEPPND
jgi:twinkle protein